MKSILLVGGGSGTAELLRAFSRVRYVSVSALVTTFDSGGSTGRLRKQFKIPAVGDLRCCVSATLPTEFAAALETRLPSGHAVGNLALAFLTKKYGFEKAVELYSGGKVLPVSFDTSTLVVKLANGKILVGEHLLDAPPAAVADEKVIGLRLQPKVALTSAARKALLAADVIVVGPGSLLGSLLPHFAVEGFTNAFQKSRAQKIFVAPGRTEFGYRGEAPAEMAARFPVMFDSVLTRTPGTRWEASALVKKILKLK